MKHGYPGTFSDIYDRIVAEAVERGVCPKVASANKGSPGYHACGKPLAPGKQWCFQHQWGV